MIASSKQLCFHACLFALALFAAACGSRDGNDGNNGRDAGSGADIRVSDRGGDGLADPSVDGASDITTDMPHIPGERYQPRPEPEIIECANDPISAGVDTCTVTPGSAAVTVLRGTVLIPGEILRNGHVVFGADGLISCAGCDCSDVSGFAEATVVACANAVISPGLINPHDHLRWAHDRPRSHGDERFEHRHDWRCGMRGHDEVDYLSGNNAAVAIGELRMLMSGVTSIAGSGEYGGMVRNLDRDNDGLGVDELNYETFPLDDVRCSLRSEDCSYGHGRDTSEYISAFGCYLPHIAEGIDAEARNEFLCTSQSPNGPDSLRYASDLIEPNTAAIHLIGLLAADVDELALNDTKLVWSPRSNIDLYGHTAQVTLFDHLGVTISLGSDWVVSGSMNQLRELACADQLNQNQFGGHFSDEDLWRMATDWAAVATGTDGIIGELAEGLMADIVIYDDPEQKDHRAILEADCGDVALVIKGGTALFGDAAVLEGLLTTVQGCEYYAVCNETKRICAERETGHTVAALSNATGVDSLYPLTSCGVPPDEPSCVPMRPAAHDPHPFTGVTSPDDADGDGIADSGDNCPDVFNPVRPLDDRSQADADNDGVGDVCDVCPFTADTDDCPLPSSDDRDRDGLSNDSDNCPSAFNPAQEDADQDGNGDACDACPDLPNQGDEPCPFDITVLRTPETAPPEGTRVLLENILVTVIQTTRSPGFFVQDSLPGDYSGLFIYTGYDNNPPAADDGTPIVPGMLVNVRGEYKVFNDLDELTEPDLIEIVSTDNAVAPRVIEPSELVTGAAATDAYESLLVRVDDVYAIRYVEDGAPAAGVIDEFFVSHSPDDTCLGDQPPCAIIGDFLYDGGDDDNQEPATTIGAHYNSITGIVNAYQSSYTIDVRTLDDLVEW